MVQSLSIFWLCNPLHAAHQSSLSFTISWSLLNSCTLTVMLFNHLILCCPLLLLSVFPGITIFFDELALPNWRTKHYGFSFSISPSNEYSGLISFRVDWFDTLTVQETRKSLLQRHYSKVPILQLSGFFMIQLSYQYMILGKTKALTI